VLYRESRQNKRSGKIKTTSEKSYPLNCGVSASRWQSCAAPFANLRYCRRSTDRLGGVRARAHGERRDLQHHPRLLHGLRLQWRLQLAAVVKRRLFLLASLLLLLLRYYCLVLVVIYIWWPPIYWLTKPVQYFLFISFFCAFYWTDTRGTVNADFLLDLCSF